nr:hypothetical protein JVH1_3361 [Rhodococcus sp. JVH1]
MSIPRVGVWVIDNVHGDPASSNLHRDEIGAQRAPARVGARLDR